MKGHRMQKLFVKGEVLSASNVKEDIHCLVNITNDGWHVCRCILIVKDIQDLERQFYSYLESDEFKGKMVAV